MRAGRIIWFATALAVTGSAAAALPDTGVPSLFGAWSFLPLGFAIGMAHALEADHLTAVATMLDRRDGKRALIARGAFWGLGHSLALGLFCGAVLLLGIGISSRTEAALELVVGLMIVGLGAQVLWRLKRDRVHVHAHDHGGRVHLHAHSHAGDPPRHRDSAHQHRHAARVTNAKALAVGLVHGAAGSAGLMVLMVAATTSTLEAIGYVAVFGIGSIAGMATLSALASVPLTALFRGAAWVRTATTATVGAAALWVGGSLAAHSLPGL